MASENGDNGERDFRLRPRKPSAAKSRATSAFVALLYHAKAARRFAKSAKTKVTSRPHQQRCSIRVMYSKTHGKTPATNAYGSSSSRRNSVSALIWKS